jgi:hypothetical protein
MGWAIFSQTHLVTLLITLIPASPCYRRPPAFPATSKSADSSSSAPSTRSASCTSPSTSSTWTRTRAGIDVTKLHSGQKLFHANFHPQILD